MNRKTLIFISSFVFGALLSILISRSCEAQASFSTQKKGSHEYILNHDGAVFAYLIRSSKEAPRCWKGKRTTTITEYNTRTVITERASVFCNFYCYTARHVVKCNNKTCTTDFEGFCHLDGNLHESGRSNVSYPYGELLRPSLM